MSGQPTSETENSTPADPEHWRVEQRNLREQAERCRRLAGALYTRENSEVLKQMAERFDRSADSLGNHRQSNG